MKKFLLSAKEWYSYQTPAAKVLLGSVLVILFFGMVQAIFF